MSKRKCGQNAGWKFHESIEESREIIRNIFLDKPDVFAIEFGGKVIGSIGLMPDFMRENPRSAMIGYAIGEPYWGRGIMTEACEAVIGHAFWFLEVDLLSINCYTDNPRSERVIVKCGFAFEGMLHAATVLYNGEIKDKKFFYLTKEKYLLNNSEISEIN